VKFGSLIMSVDINRQPKAPGRRPAKARALVEAVVGGPRLLRADRDRRGLLAYLSPNYFTLSNFLIMASHVAIFGLLAIGMLLVILNGGIDLSVGSILALAGVMAGFLMQGVEIDAILA
jgi:hypothetical protein